MKRSQISYRSLVKYTLLLLIPVLLLPGCKDDEEVIDLLEGSKIVFASDMDGNEDIFMIEYGTSVFTNLTNTPENENAADLSADRSKIVFTRWDGNDMEIWTMNADGSNQVRLTDNFANDAKPRWNMAGTRICWFSNLEGANDIYIMNADGSGKMNLTPGGSGESDPCWSPDGTKILFETNVDGDYEIYTVRISDGLWTNLSNNMDSADDDPNWSPDGEKISFCSNRDGNWEMYYMNADGSNVRRLTFTEDDVDEDGYWAPDSEHVIFTGQFNGHDELFIVRKDGTGLTNLTNNDVDDWLPSWR